MGRSVALDRAGEDAQINSSAPIGFIGQLIASIGARDIEQRKTVEDLGRHGKRNEATTPRLIMTLPAFGIATKETQA